MDSYEYKVLIVDDEDDVRNGWVAGLCALGVRGREFFAMGARTAGDALDLLSEERARGAPFNVAVLDLHLEASGEPYETDRWALARQLKELYQPYPDLGIIVVTAIHHDPADFKTASDIADGGYLSKAAIDAENLAEVIRTRFPPREAPVFWFSPAHQDDQERAFILNTGTMTLRRLPGRAKVSTPRGTGDLWFLEVFLREALDKSPETLVGYDTIYAYKDGRHQTTIPIPWHLGTQRTQGEDNSWIHQPVSRLRTLLDPVEKGIFENRRNEGYVVAARVKRVDD